MRHMTPTRLRAIGTLLLEIATVVAHVTQHIKNDRKLNTSLYNLITRFRAL
jgi:hypothetical protein